MSETGDRRLVNVVSESSALSDPAFVIRVGDKYYATLAVWEYDPNAPDLTPDQRRGVEEIAKLFREKEHGEVHRGVCVPPFRIHAAMSTNPHHN